MVLDRRKNLRYVIRNAVVITPEGVYQIEDISRGGFSFKCHPHTAISESWESEIINSEVPLEGFPSFKVRVYFYENRNSNFPSHIIVGAKFGELQQDQSRKIKKLIDRISQSSI